MFEKSITKEQLLSLPSGAYKGKTVIVNTSQQLEKAVAEIYRFETVGFDTEAKPTFKKGEYNHVAMIQIATPELVYLFRVNHTGMKTPLVKLLSDPQIKKVGISVQDDFRSLQRLRNFEPKGFIDLNTIAKDIGLSNSGAKNLAGIFLGMRISKKQQLSNWEEFRLTEKQILYAATDAWICLEIYQVMQEHGLVS